MKLLAFGDLHLGAGTALGRVPGDRLLDQNDVLDKIIGAAAYHNAEAILVAGDVFDGPVVTPEQMDVFARFVEDAEDVGVPVVAVSGNGVHDASMRAVNGLAIFGRLPGITVYSRPALHDLGPVQVACLPWVSPARLVASMDGDVDRDRVNARAAELLVTVARGLRAETDKPTVLLMHGSLSGASLPTGIATDELREPVVSTEDLLDRGFAAIVAGHIHQPQLATFDHPAWTAATGDVRWTEIDCDNTVAIYTGSPLPLNFGERATAHGVWLLDISDGLTRAEFVPIESRPLVQTTFDIADLPDHDYVDVDVVYGPDVWPEVESAIVKVTVRCTQAQQRRLDLARLREAVIGAGAHTVKIDVETVREQRSRVDGVTGELSPLDAFDAWVASMRTVSPDEAQTARVQFQADLEAVGS